MAKTYSNQQKMELLSGLINTKDITDWENSFLSSVLKWYARNNSDYDCLSIKQAAVVEKIFDKHFLSSENEGQGELT